MSLHEVFFSKTKYSVAFFAKTDYSSGGIQFFATANCLYLCTHKLISFINPLRYVCLY
jgi:hypothetical protein